MLNTKSAYFKDQLVEKLQLMLATTELTLSSYSHGGKQQTATFYIGDAMWSITFDCDDKKFNLPKALIALADDMVETMHTYLNARLVGQVIEGSGES